MSSVFTGTDIAALSDAIVAQIQAQLALTSNSSSGSSGIGATNTTPGTAAGHPNVTFTATATTAATLVVEGIGIMTPTLGTTPGSEPATLGDGTTGGIVSNAPGLAEGTIKFLVSNFQKKTEDEMMLEVQQGFISSTTTVLILVIYTISCLASNVNYVS